MILILPGLLSALSSLVAAGAFPSDPFTSKAAGTTGAPFLKNPPGARYEGMGPTSAAFAEGAESIFWNPAGLARLDAAGPSDLGMGYNHLMALDYVGSFAYAKPTQSGVFAAGLLYYSQAAQTAYDAVGSNIGTFRPYDMELAAAYARRVSSFLIGGDLKLIRSAIEEVSAVSAAVDAGVQALHVADVGEGVLDAGFAVSNFGTPEKLGGLQAPLPFTLRGGLFWKMAPQFNSALDINFPIDDDPYVTAGVEGWVNLSSQRHWKGFVRTGYSQRNARGVDGFVGVTAGGGVDLDPMRVDYAWTPYGDLGYAHRFSFGYRF